MTGCIPSNSIKDENRKRKAAERWKCTKSTPQDKSLDNFICFCRREALHCDGRREKLRKLEAMLARYKKLQSNEQREKHEIEVSRIHVTFGHKKNESCFWGCIGKRGESRQAAAANNSFPPVTLSSFWSLRSRKLFSPRATSASIKITDLESRQSSSFSLSNQRLG